MLSGLNWSEAFEAKQHQCLLIHWDFAGAIEIKNGGTVFVSDSTFVGNAGTTTGAILVDLGSTANIAVTFCSAQVCSMQYHITPVAASVLLMCLP